MFGLVIWAAGDESTRSYFTPKIRSRALCKSALLVAALEAYGGRGQPDENYKRRDDPQFNYFEKLYAELQHTHAVAEQDLKEQLTAHLTRISTLDSEQNSAKAERNLTRDNLLAVSRMSWRRHAQEASKKQASRHISVYMQAAKPRAQQAA